METHRKDTDDTISRKSWVGLFAAHLETLEKDSKALTITIFVCSKSIKKNHIKKRRGNYKKDQLSI